MDLIAIAMDESIVCYENEQIINSEECSELDTTSTAVMLVMDIISLP